MRARAATLLALALVALAPASAWAHGLRLDVRRDGERVLVEAFFSDGAPCGAARVSVRDGDGAVFLRGTTDAEGAFGFEIPPGAAGPLTVEVNDGGGHLATAEVAIGPSGPAPAAAPPEPRDERGAVPWGRVAVGLAVIFGLGAGLLLVQRRGAKRGGERE